MDKGEFANNGLLSCLDCCGGEHYIASGDEICCNDVLFRKPPNAECCRGKPIDSLKMICCEGVPQNRPPNGACCGQEAYDQRRQYCCSGEILDLEFDSTTADVTPIISKTLLYTFNRIIRFIDDQRNCAFVHSNTVITFLAHNTRKHAVVVLNENWRHVLFTFQTYIKYT